MRVTFAATNGKHELFKALSQNGTKTSSIKVSQVFPKELLEQRQNLIKVGTMLKRKEPGLKFKVIFKRGELCLYTQDSGDSTFSRMDSKNIDSEVDNSKIMTNSSNYVPAPQTGNRNKRIKTTQEQ